MTSNPWAFFIWSALVLSCLSYAPLPGKAELLIFLCLLLPAFLLSLSEPLGASRCSSMTTSEVWVPFQWWALFLVLLAGFYLRFFDLTGLSVWPIVDEGRTSLFAIHQSEHWEWKLLYGYNQLPPLFYWLFAVFFKCTGPSLSSLWLFPAVLSSLTLCVGLAAAHTIFSRSFSLLAVGLLALGFWPLYSGRFAAEGALVLLWELAALLWAGIYLRARNKTTKRFSAGWLGFWTGSGFYVHLHWPVIAIMIALILRSPAWNGAERPRGLDGDRKVFLFFTCLTPLPLFMAMARSSYGSYLSGLFAFKPGNTHALDYLRNCYSYFTCLFWGTHVDYFAYKPYWGGFLNPLLGALFLLGLAKLIQDRSSGFSRWILAGMALFFMPALLTKDLETFRVIQLLPLLLVTTALGARLLISTLSRGGSILFLAGLTLGSCSLDLHHLVKAYGGYWETHYDHWERDSKSVKFWKAYGLLSSLAGQKGPGAVLFESTFEPHDRTLVVATYPFNAAVNPKIEPDRIRWMAILQDTVEEPYLSHRFPRSVFFSLGSREKSVASSLVWVHKIGVRIIPLEDLSPNDLTRFLTANSVLQETAFIDLNQPSDQGHGPAIRYLKGQSLIFQGDPFLESLRDERLAGYYLEDHDDPQALKTTQKLTEHGCVGADAYHRLGVLLVKARDHRSAISAFQEAGRRNPTFKPPDAVIERLSREGSVRPALMGSTENPKTQ